MSTFSEKTIELFFYLTRRHQNLLPIIEQIKEKIRKLEIAKT